MDANINIDHNLIQANQSENIDQWFSQFIDHLKVDHFLLQTNSATEEKKEFYKAVMSGDEILLASQVRNTSSKVFVKRIIFEYLQELKSNNKMPLKLAFGISDSKILVWSEVNDNDEETEDALFLTEAKINGKYHKYGFYLNSTIVESSDKMSIPNHYQNIL